MSKATLSKRERGVSTPSQHARLTDQRAAAAAARAWREVCAQQAEKRHRKAAKARREAGPQGGQLRALTRLARLFGSTPVTQTAVQMVDRDRRGRMLPHRNLEKDRSLSGKARIRARRAARR
jgi:hypothetical protein